MPSHFSPAALSPLNKAVRIYVWDEDLVSDDSMGYCEFKIESEADVPPHDLWLDVLPRPGKKDKNIKGQIHIQWSCRFMKNYKVDPSTEWPDFSLVTIEPVQFRNVVDVQGPIDDLVLLSCLAECRIKRMPEKYFSKHLPKESIGWVIKVCSESSISDMYSYATKWKWDLVQNVCLRLLNQFANYGFALLRADQMHVIRGKNVIKTFDQTLWLVRSRTSANKVTQSTFLLVEPYYMCHTSKIRVEIQGDMDPAILGEFLVDFSYEERRDRFGEHVSFSLVDKYQLPTFTTMSAIRMRENASENLVLKALDQLHKYGFAHWTVWGEAHILMRSNEWAASGAHVVTGRVGNYIIVDPLWILGSSAQIEVQGLVDDNLIVQIAASMGGSMDTAKIELQKRMNHNGQFSHYSFKSRQVFPDSVFAGVMAWRKSENVFQNLTLEVVTKLGEVAGYEVMSPFGTDCLMLQRSITPSSLPPNKRFKYVLIDPCFSLDLPAQFEIQGDITAEEAGAASLACGCSTIMDERDSKFGHTSWIIPVAKTGGMTWSLTEMRRKMNKVQYYGMKLLSYFNNVLSYEPFMQYAADSFLCRMRGPEALIRGQFILVDTLFTVDTFVRVEVTGDITRDEVAAAAAAGALPAPQDILDPKENNLLLGYCIKTDVKAMAYTLEGMHKMNNRWQYIWIKFVNRLSSFGWQYKFPYGHGRDRGHVFFRPFATQ